MTSPHTINATNNLRLGHVLNPQQVRDEAAALVQRPRVFFDGFCVATSLPQWLVAEIERAKTAPAVRFAVFQTLDEMEYVAFLILQFAGAQLRCLFPLSDANVQLLMNDCLQSGTFQMMLFLEGRQQARFMQLPMQLPRREELREFLRVARPNSGGVEILRKMATAQTAVDFEVSLIEGQPVTKALSLLVGTDLHEGLGAKREAGVRSARTHGSSLH